MIRVVVEAGAPEPTAIAQAAAAIRRGAIVLIPTDTLYGLAVDAFSPDAVDRLVRLKGRPAGQPIPLIAADLAQVTAQVGRLPAAALRLASAFWPGPLTLVVPAPAGLPAAVTAGTRTVGVRVPNHPVARALCAAAGCVLTATSANVSGAPPSSDPGEAAHGVGHGVDVRLDAGSVPGGAASTVLDVTAGDVRVVRDGAVAWSEIRECLGIR
jgi:L-threonylcarbamoyladenylate synthase